MEEVLVQIKTELTSLCSFGRKVHKCNNYSQKTKVKKKNRPKYSNIVNIHLTSLNRFNPILRNRAETFISSFWRLVINKTSLVQI